MEDFDIPFYDVFLSYSVKDGKLVEEIATKLIADGFDVFYDKLCIFPGQNIHIVLESALEKSIKIIYFLTPNSIKSEWIPYEINYYWRNIHLQNEGKMIPLLLIKCDIPRNIENLKFIDFTINNFNMSYNELIKLLKKVYFIRIGPYLLKNDSKQIKYFIDFVCRKIGLYFNYNKERIYTLELAYNELVQNAFLHVNKPQNNIEVFVEASDKSIKLEVTDNGIGFNILKHIINITQLILKEPLSVKSRGIYLVYNNCDLLINKVIKKRHTIIAEIYKIKIEKSIIGKGFVDILSKVSFKCFYIKVNSKKIDWHNSVTFQQIVSEYILLNKDLEVLIIDLTQTEFIDSGGLNALVSIFKICGANNRNVTYSIIAVNEGVIRIFKLVRMDKVFHVSYSLEESLDVIEKKIKEQNHSISLKFENFLKIELW